jgi:hypothetical protein
MRGPPSRLDDGLQQAVARQQPARHGERRGHLVETEAVRQQRPERLRVSSQQGERVTDVTGGVVERAADREAA